MDSSAGRGTKPSQSTKSWMDAAGAVEGAAGGDDDVGDDTDTDTVGVKGDTDPRSARPSLNRDGHGDDDIFDAVNSGIRDQATPATPVALAICLDLVTKVLPPALPIATASVVIVRYVLVLVEVVVA